METKGDLEKNRGKRDEGTGMDFGILGGCSSRQTTVVFSGGGTMPKPA